MNQNAANDHRTGIDSTVPHSARFWNYLLGGKENYEVDREIGDYVRANFPRLVTVAQESRLFLGRAVRHAVEQEGIRQFTVCLAVTGCAKGNRSGDHAASSMT